jgi:hypothetical protein
LFYLRRLSLIAHADFGQNEKSYFIYALQAMADMSCNHRVGLNFRKKILWIFNKWIFL